MIHFNATNVKGENPMWVKLFVIGGDGESKVLKVSLEASPVGMEFRGGKKPTLAFHRQHEGPQLNWIVVNDGILFMEFSRPLALGEWVHIPIEFYYEG